MDDQKVNLKQLLQRSQNFGGDCDGSFFGVRTRKLKAGDKG